MTLRRLGEKQVTVHDSRRVFTWAYEMNIARPGPSSVACPPRTRSGDRGLQPGDVYRRAPGADDLLEQLCRGQAGRTCGWHAGYGCRRDRSRSGSQEDGLTRAGGARQEGG